MPDHRDVATCMRLAGSLDSTSTGVSLKIGPDHGKKILIGRMGNDHEALNNVLDNVFFNQFRCLSGNRFSG